MEFGIADVLSNLLSFPDHVTRMTATECLIKICCRQNGREAVAKAACLLPQALLRLDDLARSHFSVGDDNSITMVMKEMRALLNLLESMFFCNKRLRLELRPADRSATVLAVVASARTLCNLVCSLLNTWKPCSTYYGISPDGLVRGVVLNHKERDALRCGIDFVAGNLRPHLTPTSIGVELVPVLRDAADKPEKAHRYMVEVRVLGLHRVVYTTSEGECDLRENDKSYQARTFDVRAWIVRLEEDYLQVKNRASLKECDLPAAGDVSRC
ncbi:hypothetical protein MRX96_019491 [Rhipicephalus microplus]